MKLDNNRLWQLVRVVPMCAAALAMVLPLPTRADDYTNYVRIFSFGGTNGENPSGDLLEGADGMLYGTTSEGGITNDAFPTGMGTVFRIGRDGTGFQVLHPFGNVTNDGQVPNSALLEGSNGTFYGTTIYGGTVGLGIIFNVSKDGASYNVLKSFIGGTNDGANPQGGLMLGSDGFLYGTASSQDAQDDGLLYKLNQNGSNYVALSALVVSFGDGGYGNGAASPVGALLEGTNGQLYGVSVDGWVVFGVGQGSSTHGTVFAIAKDGTGFSVDPYEFYANVNIPLWNPNGPLADGGDGFLYGTTTGGGNLNGGCVFRFSAGGAYWNFAVLADLRSIGSISSPLGGLIRGPDGLFYGTASSSIGTPANAPCYGGVFKIDSQGTNLATLKAFTAPTDGQSPIGELLFGSDGGMYGTTSDGGDAGYGTIYALFPNNRSWFTSSSLNGNHGLVLNALATAGVTYRLQSTTNLSQGTWIDVATNIASATGNLCFSNLSVSGSVDFYRLISP